VRAKRGNLGKKNCPVARTLKGGGREARDKKQKTQPTKKTKNQIYQKGEGTHQLSGENCHSDSGAIQVARKPKKGKRKGSIEILSNCSGENGFVKEHYPRFARQRLHLKRKRRRRVIKTKLLTGQYGRANDRDPSNPSSNTGTTSQTGFQVLRSRKYKTQPERRHTAFT